MTLLEPGTVLLIEDNEDDVFAMRRALRAAQIFNPLEVIASGKEAIDYLSGCAKDSRGGRPLPILIFIDLKLPDGDGFEILKWIREQPYLDSIPVVVLTASSQLPHFDRAYKLGARSYLVKPPRPEDLVELSRSLRPFWLARRL